MSVYPRVLLCNTLNMLLVPFLVLRIFVSLFIDVSLNFHVPSNIDNKNQLIKVSLGACKTIR